MKSTLVNMTAVLFGITLVASAGVGVVNMITEEPIALAKEAATKRAPAEVPPAFESTEEQTLTIDELPITVYTARNGGEVAGYAVQTMTKQGFNGVVRLMVGFTPDGEVVNVNVLEQSETPGLGTKMADEGNVLLGSIQGQKLENKKLVGGKLAVTKDGGQRIDDLLARLRRCREPCLDGLQERSDRRRGYRHRIRRYAYRRYTNQRACGSGRRAT